MFKIKLGTVINVPIELPILERKKTNKACVTLFLYHPKNEQISSERFSMSRTFGFLINASIIPVKKPTPINGFMEVRGAIRKAAIIVIGLAKAIIEPRAAKPPFQRV